jgi:hypothetical protein
MKNLVAVLVLELDREAERRSAGPDDVDAELAKLPSMSGAERRTALHRMARLSNSARPANNMDDRLPKTDAEG